MDICKINLKEKYQREIFGLGEVYEIISVNFLRKKLLRKFKSGVLYLASNKNHSLRELKDLIHKGEELVIKEGYVDSPPWSSRPRGQENKKSYNWLIVFLAKIIFYFLVRFEFFWQNPKKSHMIYLLTKR